MEKYKKVSKRGEILRAKKMIESDRLGVVYGTEDLIRRDLESLLKEYFCIDKPLKIEIIAKGERISLNISTDCASIKRFNLLK